MLIYDDFGRSFMSNPNIKVGGWGTLTPNKTVNYDNFANIS